MYKLLANTVATERNRSIANSQDLKTVAAAPMANLPQEIIIDVLSRLPVKSVIRFRCVCKSWLSSISKPEFVKTHLNRSITDVNVGCLRILHCSSPFISIDCRVLPQNNADSACTTELDFLHHLNHHDFSVSGSCNGMLCILLDRNKIILCNPCTSDFRDISITLNHVIYACGLGYDSSVDDYKVLIVVPAAPNDDQHQYYGHFSGETKAEVFSLRNNSWKTLTDFHPNFDGFEDFGGAFLNGTLHWLAIHGPDQVILSFELATEKFHELLPLPHEQCNNDVSYFSNLIVLGRNLSVSILFYHEGCVRNEFWVMKEYGVEASWTKLFTICEEGGLGTDYYLRPLCFLKSGEILVDVNGIQLRIYNPKEETSRKVYTPNGGYWDRNETSVYIESLVSPNFNLNQ